MGPALAKLVTAPVGMRRLEAPTVDVDGENPVCGDRMHFEAAITDEDLRALAFRATACPACIAVASCAVRVYEGRAVPAGPPFEALRAEVARLGGLSRFEQHALALVEELLARLCGR